MVDKIIRLPAKKQFRGFCYIVQKRAYYIFVASAASMCSTTGLSPLSRAGNVFDAKDLAWLRRYSYSSFISPSQLVMKPRLLLDLLGGIYLMVVALP